MEQTRASWSVSKSHLRPQKHHFSHLADPGSPPVKGLEIGDQLQVGNREEKADKQGLEGDHR